MERLEPLVTADPPDLAFVPGDVNSTLAAALVLVKLGVPYAHVESGLRSFDRSMPEEINRIVADEFADYLFAHSDDAVENLRREGIEPERIHLVGNTMIDTLCRLEPRFRGLQIADQLELQSTRVRARHPPSPVARGRDFFPVLEQLQTVAERMPVVFPVHPRTRARIAAPERYPDVRFLAPLGYLEFLSLEADAAAVLTDSGGVQEETTFLGVPCFTLRAVTERPVTTRLGTNVVLGLDPARITEILDAIDVLPSALTVSRRCGTGKPPNGSRTSLSTGSEGDRPPHPHPSGHRRWSADARGRARDGSRIRRRRCDHDRGDAPRAG